MILSEACLWSGGVWALLLVQPLSMVGMAPHKIQELVGTCWGPFEIWVHLGQGLHGLQLWQRHAAPAGLRMNQRHIEWKIGLIPGHWPFAFEAIADSQGRCTIGGIET